MTHVLQLQATAAYNDTRADASNGSAELTHWPLELLAFYDYRPYGLRFGGGLQYQLGVSFDGTGSLASSTTSFDNALGLVLQIL
ncbi:hypothetical protein [Hyalangium sp.]|uniref:hypothetical protein n=1 Tax=Hyalangium sp. TaxID=2028555 RepID=UPI002D607FD2|nr:hypothetical protein [Hyalangium sp.]HYI02242.1 hypothetical protein [Hyalangium sp.]